MRISIIFFHSLWAHEFAEFFFLCPPISSTRKSLIIIIVVIEIDSFWWNQIDMFEWHFAKGYVIRYARSTFFFFVKICVGKSNKLLATRDNICNKIKSNEISLTWNSRSIFFSIYQFYMQMCAYFIFFKLKALCGFPPYPISYKKKKSLYIPRSPARLHKAGRKRRKILKA